MNNNSQYRIVPVLTSSNGPSADTSDNTTTTDNTTVDNGGAGGSDTDTVSTTGTPDVISTDKPTDSNKPIIVLLEKPSSTEDTKNNGVVTPSAMAYYGVMTAIMIALLAVAYNSVKTANIPKS
jgi:hypothetical protein